MMRTNQLMAVLLIGTVLTSQAAAAQHGAVHDRLPAMPDVRARYVIYLHGRIIEDQGRRPTHATWGTYEYQQILDTLAANGLVVVSEQRPPMTDMGMFASHVADQVRALLRAGVPPEQVSVVGFSKGGGIAIRTSALLQNPRINFVFLAACGDGDFSGFDTKVWGRILSVYEASDEAGRSCQCCSPSPGRPGNDLKYASTLEKSMARSSGPTTSGSHLYSRGSGWADRGASTSYQRALTPEAITQMARLCIFWDWFRMAGTLGSYLCFVKAASLQ